MVNQVRYESKKDARVIKENWAVPEAWFFLDRANDIKPEIYKDQTVARIVTATKELNLKLAEIFK
jgi:phage major head subunit gpT-like protein